VLDNQQYTTGYTNCDRKPTRRTAFRAADPAPRSISWNKKGEKSRRVPITAQIAIRKGAKRNYATSGNGSRRTVLDLCEYNLIPNEIRLSHSTRSNLLLLGDVEKGKSTSASGGREESNGITPPSSERKCLSVVLGSIFNKRSVVFVRIEDYYSKGPEDCKTRTKQTS
jgi:hypothetical protein